MEFSAHAKSGLIGGVPLAAAGLFFNDPEYFILAGVLFFIGAVFPDLDTDSIPSRWAARIGALFIFAMIAIDKLLPAAVAGLLFFVIKSFAHRKFTHKYWIPALCILLVFFFDNQLYLTFGAGIIVHFWLDKISPLSGRNWV